MQVDFFMKFCVFYPPDDSFMIIFTSKFPSHDNSTFFPEFQRTINKRNSKLANQVVDLSELSTLTENLASTRYWSQTIILRLNSRHSSYYLSIESKTEEQFDKRTEKCKTQLEPACDVSLEIMSTFLPPMIHELCSQVKYLCNRKRDVVLSCFPYYYL